jgi:hypothetical protein
MERTTAGSTRLATDTEDLATHVTALERHATVVGRSDRRDLRTDLNH